MPANCQLGKKTHRRFQLQLTSSLILVLLAGTARAYSDQASNLRRQGIMSGGQDVFHGTLHATFKGVETQDRLLLPLSGRRSRRLPLKATV